MKTHVLTIKRTINVVAHIHIEADSNEDAVQRFQHQLEAEQCSEIEDEGLWGEIFYYQIVKAGPYGSAYDVIDVDVLED